MKVGRMSWINWFVKKKPEPVPPVGSHVRLPRSKPKPHHIKVHSVSRTNVCFSVDGGAPNLVVLKGGQSPEDAITEFVQREDEKEAREKEELSRIQEELDKRF